MRLYSDVARQRAAQIIGDVLAVVVLIIGIMVAVAVHGTIAALGAIGRNVQESGTGLASTMTEVGDNLASIPLIGGSIRAPFDAASGAGGTLANAGRDWQAGVQALAAGTSGVIVAVVVLLLLLLWVRPRVVGAVRRSRLARLTRSPGSLELLAFRALTNRAPEHLVAIHPDVTGAWRHGDPTVVRRLAALELESAGLRLGN